jgi:hypothetical protein
LYVQTVRSLRNRPTAQAAVHALPVAVLMPRSLSDLAAADATDQQARRTSGAMPRLAPALAAWCWIAAEFDALGFGRSGRSLGPAIDHAALLRGDHGHHFDQHRFGIQAQR